MKVPLSRGSAPRASQGTSRTPKPKTKGPRAPSVARKKEGKAPKSSKLEAKTEEANNETPEDTGAIDLQRDDDRQAPVRRRRRHEPEPMEGQQHVSHEQQIEDEEDPKDRESRGKREGHGDEKEKKQHGHDDEDRVEDQIFESSFESHLMGRGPRRFAGDVGPGVEPGDTRLTDPDEVQRVLGSPVAYAKHALILSEAFRHATGATRAEALAYLASLFTGAADRPFARAALREFGPGTGIVDIYPLEVMELVLETHPGFLQKVGFGRLFPQAGQRERPLVTDTATPIELDHPEGLRVRRFALKGGGCPGYVFEPSPSPERYRLTIQSPGSFDLLVSGVTRSGHTLLQRLYVRVLPARGEAPALPPALSQVYPPRDADKVEEWPKPNPKRPKARDCLQFMVDEADEATAKRDEMRIELAHRRARGANNELPKIGEGGFGDLSSWNFDPLTVAPVLEASKAPVLDASKAPVLEASKAPVLEASKAPVLEASKAPVLEASKAPVLEASKAPMLEATKQEDKKSPPLGAKARKHEDLGRSPPPRRVMTADASRRDERADASPRATGEARRAPEEPRRRAEATARGPAARTPEREERRAPQKRDARTTHDSEPSEGQERTPRPRDRSMEPRSMEPRSMEPRSIEPRTARERDESERRGAASTDEVRLAELDGPQADAPQENLAARWSEPRDATPEQGSRASPSAARTAEVDPSERQPAVDPIQADPIDEPIDLEPIDLEPIDDLEASALERRASLSTLESNESTEEPPLAGPAAVGLAPAQSPVRAFTETPTRELEIEAAIPRARAFAEAPTRELERSESPVASRRAEASVGAAMVTEFDDPPTAEHLVSETRASLTDLAAGARRRAAQLASLEVNAEPTEARAPALRFPLDDPPTAEIDLSRVPRVPLTAVKSTEHELPVGGLKEAPPAPTPGFTQRGIDGPTESIELSPDWTPPAVDVAFQEEVPTEASLVDVRALGPPSRPGFVGVRTTDPTRRLRIDEAELKKKR